MKQMNKKKVDPDKVTPGLTPNKKKAATPKKTMDNKTAGQTWAAFRTVIKAEYFFPKYAPDISDWRGKIRGYDGKKNPVDFTLIDQKHLSTGINKLCKDLNAAAKEILK